MSAYIPAPRVPIIDARTGMVSREWYRYLQELFEQIGGVAGVIPVPSGGTGITAGVSGGVLGFTGTTTLASSALLTASALVLGGGAGATPSTPVSLGTTTTVLHGNASGAPSWAKVNLSNTVTDRLPLANLGGVGGTGTILRSNGTDYAATTATYPNTVTANRLIRGSSANVIGETTNLTWDESALTLTGDQTISGFLAVGTTISTLSGFRVNKTFTDVENSRQFEMQGTVTASAGNITNAQGVLATPIFNPTTTGSNRTITNASGQIIKTYFAPQMGASATVGTTTLIGTQSRLAIFPTTSVLGTVTQAVDLDIPAANNEATGATVVFTNHTGLRVANMGTATGNAGLTFGNAKGIAIAEQSGGTVSNYALQIGSTNTPTGGAFSIYNNSANKSYHAPNLGLGSGITAPTAKLHIAAGSATANTAPQQFASGGSFEATPRAGLYEYNGRFAVTESDVARRYLVQAAAATKTTAGAPYTNDGYIPMVINGTTVNVMTTA